jgi:dynein heavy chain
MLDNKRNFIDS